MLRSLTSTTRLIVFLLALLLSVIFLLPKQTRDALQTVGNPASYVMAWPLDILASIRASIVGVWEDYIALRHVRDENRFLRQQLNELQLQNSELRELATSGERWAGLLQFKERFTPETVAAQVIGRDTSNWYRAVIVNKGERDGVRPEMGVMAPRGVVGRVIKVGPSSAVVLLVTDPNNAITGIIQRSRDEGIVEGTLQGTARIKYLPLLAGVRIGDLVVTSGLTGGFPRGIAIGTVERIDKQQGELFQSAQIQPHVDMSKVEEVLIITVPRPLTDVGPVVEGRGP